MEGLRKPQHWREWVFASYLAHQFEQALDESPPGHRDRQAATVPHVYSGPGFTVVGPQRSVMGVWSTAGDGSSARWASPVHRGRGDHVPSLIMLGEIQNWQGRVRRGASLMAEACASAGSTIFSPGHHGVSGGGGSPSPAKGTTTRRSTGLEEGLALCQKVGGDFYRGRILNTLGWLWMECGEPRPRHRSQPTGCRECAEARRSRDDRQRRDQPGGRAPGERRSPPGGRTSWRECMA